MKLHVLSDIHIEFESFDAPATDADAVVLAGDIHIGRNGKVVEEPCFQLSSGRFSRKPSTYANRASRFRSDRQRFPKADVQIQLKQPNLGAAFGQDRTFANNE